MTKNKGASKNEGDDNVSDEDSQNTSKRKFDPSNFDHNGHDPLSEAMNMVTPPFHV